MQVSFTGFKNIGCIQSSDSQDFTRAHINIQLTDDYNSKDLSQYKALLNKPGMSIYRNKLNSKFINIATQNKSSKKGNDFTIYVNNCLMPITDENLPMLSFITKLLRRVKETPKSELVVNNDYKTDPDTAKLIIPGFDFRSHYNKENQNEEYYQMSMDIIHSPETVHEGSKLIFGQIQNKMIDYFS